MVLGVFDIQAMEGGASGDGEQNPSEEKVVRKRGRGLRFFRRNKKKIIEDEITEDNGEDNTQLQEDIKMLGLQVAVGELQATVVELQGQIGDSTKNQEKSTETLQLLAAFVKAQSLQRQEEADKIGSMEKRFEQFGEILADVARESREGRDELTEEVSGLRGEFHNSHDTLHEILRTVQTFSPSASSATLTLSIIARSLRLAAMSL